MVGVQVNSIKVASRHGVAKEQRKTNALVDMLLNGRDKVDDFEHIHIVSLFI